MNEVLLFALISSISFNIVLLITLSVAKEDREDLRDCYHSMIERQKNSFDNLNHVWCEELVKLNGHWAAAVKSLTDSISNKDEDGD